MKSETEPLFLKTENKENVVVNDNAKLKGI